ncbi:EamA family transporter RarD [Roseibacterium sp. SDUM158017]|uniref:EamA family transporter RarD n=1 Tax=Roseicyclus salinarum TaxID=3036773 RepID=UPI00241560AC|nr:EamA family transporter RarD [Roseibacterium sp. SDUM158017]MDG4648772.1 EamA family transporter RarD [Roseibacterium sp. SDUM158017]
MSDASKGVLAMALACAVWGLSPLFYALLDHVPPLEILAHRTIWSLVTFAAVLTFQRRLAELPRALSTPRLFALTAAAAAMISVNWFLFIYAVGVGRTVEASLGYYIFPLVAVAIGAIVLRESLSAGQKVAVAMAAAAVAVLTVGLGAAPWISLVLATTFGIYGLLKRWVVAGPVVSVAAEVLLFLPLAAGFLAWVWATRGMEHSAGDMALFVLSGPLTAVPLMLFSYAARRAAMATIGLIQYVNPTLQFLVAVLVLNEAVTAWHMIAFPLIWAALAVYSVATLRPLARPAPP